MNLKYIPYSFSKISSFNSCPQKFKFQYIDKIGVPFFTTPALTKGKAVHYCIENSHLTYEQYKKSIKDDIEEYPEILEIVNNFKNSELGKKYLFNIKRKPLNEYKLGLTKDIKACEYSRDSLFNGIVDYICVIEENGEEIFCLIDFKTGKYKDERFMNYDQLLYYSIHFFVKYKLPKIKISFVYVEHNLENSLTLEYKYLNNYIKEFLQSIVKIEKCNDFNKNITKLCSYCPFEEICK